MNLIDINMLNGLRSILGDEIFDITQLYAEQVGPDVAKIQICHTSGDFLQLKQLAHALKGGSANMGALEMARLAACIEKAAMGDAGAEVTAAVQALEETARLTLEAMRQADLLRA